MMEDEYTCHLRGVMIDIGYLFQDIIFSGYLNKNWERYWDFMIWGDVCSN